MQEFVLVIYILLKTKSNLYAVYELGCSRDTFDSTTPSYAVRLRKYHWLKTIIVWIGVCKSAP